MLLPLAFGISGGVIDRIAGGGFSNMNGGGITQNTQTRLQRIKIQVLSVNLQHSHSLR
jgi:hypothetical protein